MFRVSRSEERSRTVILVDGQLNVDGIETVEACCDQEISTGKPVHLLLRDLTDIDQAGQALLRRLSAKGVCLFATGVYTSHVLRTVCPSAHGGS